MIFGSCRARSQPGRTIEREESVPRKRLDPMEDLFSCPKCGQTRLPVLKYVPRRLVGVYTNTGGGDERIYTAEHMKVSCLCCGYTEKRAPADTEDTP